MPSNESHLPEVPPSNDRFAAVRTSEDLVVKTFGAIIVSEVESSIPVLVLDYELDPHVTGPGTHCFQLERSVVARKHAAVAVARIIHEGAGFLWIKAKRQHSIPDAVPGVTIEFLTSLLGQVAPSPKHLAWAFWVPKASMPVMAVMIEVVFILLVDLGRFRCLRFVILFVLRILLRMIEERWIVSWGNIVLLYVSSTAFGLGLQASCGRRRMSSYHVQLLTE